MKKQLLLLFILSVFIATTSFRRSSNANKGVSYLALGDSYTIGESIAADDKWPRQLIDSLEQRGVEISQSTVIAKTGWRTDDLLKAAKKNLHQDKYDLVSLSIGVNNEYQGWDPETFEPEFEKCLKYAIKHCKNGKNGVFVLSIPDYGYTPFGKKNQPKISSRIDQYNTICKRTSQEYEVRYFDITPISRRNPDDKSLVAKDGLHPSSKQYSYWVGQIIEEVFQLTSSWN